METLHTHSFRCEHGTVSIQECPGRWCVMVRLEGILDDCDEYSIRLTAPQWNRLCAFDPFQRTTKVRPLCALVFADHPNGHVLEISETWDHDTVQLRMYSTLSPDPDESLNVALTEAEWAQLVGLTVLDLSQPPGLLDVDPPNESEWAVH